MRVLILANHLNPGGIASYSLTLARHLSQEGLRVVLASGGGRLVDSHREDVAHYRVSLDTSSELNPKLFGAFFELRSIIERERIDILHDQTRVTQVLSHFLAKRFRLGRVSTCHGFFKRRWMRRVFPLWGERVIAPSVEVKEHLLREWHLGEERVSVVPHGVPATGPDETLQHRIEIRRRLGLGEDEIILGFLGRLSDVKGADILIRSLKHLDLSHVWRLLIVGDGREAPRLRGLANREGVSERIKFLEPVSNPRDWISSFDIFCAPSRQEGFGLSILEAMAAGIPVVGTRVGAIPSLIRDGAEGLLVRAESPEELAQAVMRLMRDRSLRVTLGQRAREHVGKRYPLEGMIRGTLRVYEEVFPLASRRR